MSISDVKILSCLEQLKVPSTLDTISKHYCRKYKMVQFEVITELFAALERCVKCGIIFKHKNSYFTPYKPSDVKSKTSAKANREVEGKRPTTSAKVQKPAPTQKTKSVPLKIDTVSVKEPDEPISKKTDKRSIEVENPTPRKPIKLILKRYNRNPLLNEQFNDANHLNLCRCCGRQNLHLPYTIA